MTLTWKDAQGLISEHTQEVTSEQLVRDPLVTVSVVTYNHAPFIRQALDSVLAQETTFPFEIIIGDDCSEDGTSAIVREYQSQHPDKVRLLSSSSRLGQFTGNGRLNALRNLQNCRGQFIALLEGDDFWCDISKLATQTALMQSDATISLTCHRVEYLVETGMSTPWLSRYTQSDGNILFPDMLTQQDITWQQLLKRNTIQTCSIQFRRDRFCMPEWMLNFALLDWPLCLTAASCGRIVYSPKVAAKYRVHPNSYWSSSDTTWRAKVTREMLVETFLRTGDTVSKNPLWLAMTAVRSGLADDLCIQRLRQGGYAHILWITMVILKFTYVPRRAWQLARKLVRKLRRRQDHAALV